MFFIELNFDAFLLAGTIDKALLLSEFRERVHEFDFDIRLELKELSIGDDGRRVLLGLLGRRVDETISFVEEFGEGFRGF